MTSSSKIPAKTSTWSKVASLDPFLLECGHEGPIVIAGKAVVGSSAVCKQCTSDANDKKKRADRVVACLEPFVLDCGHRILDLGLRGLKTPGHPFQCVRCSQGDPVNESDAVYAVADEHGSAHARVVAHLGPHPVPVNTVRDTSGLFFWGGINWFVAADRAVPPCAGCGSPERAWVGPDHRVFCSQCKDEKPSMPIIIECGVAAVVNRASWLASDPRVEASSAALEVQDYAEAGRLFHAISLDVGAAESCNVRIDFAAAATWCLNAAKDETRAKLVESQTLRWAESLTEKPELLWYANREFKKSTTPGDPFTSARKKAAAVVEAVATPAAWAKSKRKGPLAKRHEQLAAQAPGELGVLTAAIVTTEARGDATFAAAEALQAVLALDNSAPIFDDRSQSFNEGFAYGQKAANSGALFGSKALRRFAEAMALRCCTREKSASNVKAWADGYVAGYGEPSTLAEPHEALGIDLTAALQASLDVNVGGQTYTPVSSIPEVSMNPVQSSTALAVVDQNTVVEVQAKANEALASLNYFKAVVIDSPPMLEWAAVVIKQAKDQSDALETKRTSITKPILESKRGIDALFSPAIGYYDEIERVLKEKVANFTQLQRMQQQQAMAQAAQTYQQGGIPTQVIPQVATAQGVTVREGWTYQIVDEAAVPRALCSPDSRKISAYLPQGDALPPTIPGIQFFKTSNVAVRR